jgi:hypothetical protein
VNAAGIPVPEPSVAFLFSSLLVLRLLAGGRTRRCAIDS